jgi:hypothetical protein
MDALSRDHTSSGRVLVARAVACLALTGAIVAVTPAVSVRGGPLGHRLVHDRHHPRHRRRRSSRHPGSASRVALWSATRPCANADTPATQSTTTRMTWAVDCLVDQQRSIHGLPVLQVSSKLSKAAQGWTDRMEAEDIFEHGSDRAFSKRLLAVG